MHEICLPDLHPPVTLRLASHILPRGTHLGGGASTHKGFSPSLPPPPPPSRRKFYFLPLVVTWIVSVESVSVYFCN